MVITQKSLLYPTVTNPTWYVYDQFSFDPIVEMRHPNNAIQTRDRDGNVTTHAYDPVSKFGAKTGTSFYEELQYLYSKGYKATADGMSLIKP